VLSALDGNFSEKPVSLGLSYDGRVVEVLKSPNGTWTIIMTAPNGVSCLLMAGNHWQNVVLKAKELKL
jgi:DNA-binding beta-propeller fold protein YncE